MHIAASIGDTESITQLLCHQMGPRLLNTKNETGNSPLHYAASKGHLDVPFKTIIPVINS
jgi:ankyrin repeat protein